MTKRFLISMIAALLLPCFGAVAQDVSAQRDRKAQLEKEIEIIDRQLSDNRAKSKDAVAELELLRKKIANRKELLKQADREIRRYADQIAVTQKEINRCQARLNIFQESFYRLVKSAYRNRDVKVWYMYVLASDNVGQAYRRYGYFKSLSRQIRTQADALRRAKAELQAKKSELDTLKNQAQEVRNQRQNEVNSLSAEEKQLSNLVANLQKNKKKYEKDLKAKKKQVEALDKEIRRLLEEAMRAANSSKTTVDTKLSSEFAANSGKLPWPVDGVVVGRFGKQNDPAFKNLQVPTYNGITIAVAAKSEVKAVFDGVVQSIGVVPGYNLCILVQHGQYFTFYCKIESSFVKVGDKVKTGQAIGVVGGGENQLHFQLWKERTPQNPETWLKK